MSKIITCSDCGQSKPHKAFGLCNSCYNKHYRRTNNYTQPKVVCIECGEYKEHNAHGLCKSCYLDIYNKKTRNNKVKVERKPNLRHCDRCGKYKKHKAFGLCSTCYLNRRYHKHGRKQLKHKRVLAMVYDLVCQKCRISFPLHKLHVDHIHPVSKADSYAGNHIDEYSNLQLLCQPCNSSKGNEILDFRTL